MKQIKKNFFGRWESDSKGLINTYKKRTAKPHSFLVIGTTLAWDNPIHFKKNLLERI